MAARVKKSLVVLRNSTMTLAVLRLFFCRVENLVMLCRERTFGRMLDTISKQVV